MSAVLACHRLERFELRTGGSIAGRDELAGRAWAPLPQTECPNPSVFHRPEVRSLRHVAQQGERSDTVTVSTKSTSSGDDADARCRLARRSRRRSLRQKPKRSWC